MSSWRVCIVYLLLPATVSAAEMRSVEVDYKDGIYTLESEVFFDAAREPVFDIFLDWDLAVDFSSIIIESRNVGPDAQGDMGYFIHNRGCIWFYCVNVLRNGSVTAEQHTLIRAIADPANSDFEISDETWTFMDEGAGTLVRYELTMKPSFWIPPLIGPWVMKRKLRDDGGGAIDRIERIAQQRAVRDE